MGDVAYLRQAIESLVDNAVRFAPSGGTITVSGNLIDPHVVIEISDTGNGISEDDLPHIFEQFYRADKVWTTRGFGLGLSIAKAIIELHQGRIEVESEVGKGSTFRVLLPTM